MRLRKNNAPNAGILGGACPSGVRFPGLAFSLYTLLALGEWAKPDSSVICQSIRQMFVALPVCFT